MASFTFGINNLSVQVNHEGWGPIIGEKLSQFEHVPYAHFDKKERCFRLADFSANPAHYKPNPRFNPRSRGDDRDGNTEFSHKYDATEDNTFHLVDSSKSHTKNKLGRKLTSCIFLHLFLN